MIDVLAETLHTLILLPTPINNGMMQFAWKFIPFVLLFELPVYLFIMMGILRYYLRNTCEEHNDAMYYPKVSCLITCYSEGEDVAKTICSLAEQIYPGIIEIIPIIDGAVQNNNTYQTALRQQNYVRTRPNRRLYVIPKWSRGGRVSSLNTGLSMAGGEVVMALDGDTSFDNNMVASACRHFADPDVIGVAGSLRVRNAMVNLVTRFQAREYMLSIHASKTGLSEFNVVNNISGAFGIFRKNFIKNIGGWKNLIMQLWTGIFFQLVMPFIIIIYSMYVFTIYSPGFVLGVWILVYLFYMMVASSFSALHILFKDMERVGNLKRNVDEITPGFKYGTMVGS